ncbi:hypothetical protein [Microcoleus sp. FACHB-672]|uniref:hypothetical protein n=1 Tax=Microcoleus sp. FACHB-672 TaxID=2692825 RepID=UPI001682D333|nr:hypothetical protein [Microcoleus sp. FACHB-672]MBD2039822.1 hypothetical protein [Microcoleus sp. FACHB-672]
MEKTNLHIESIFIPRDRSTSLRQISLWAYLPIISILAIVAWQAEIPLGNLTRDPLVTVEQPFYIGFFSNIGILFWCAAAAICLFSFALLQNHYRSRRMHSFILYSGILTSVLLLDDLFMIHEEVAPKYLFVPEKFVYLIYALMLLVYLVKFRKTILKTDFSLLVLALAWFALSIVFDKGIIPLSPSLLERGFDFYLEDAAKLLGIVSWFAYLAKVCGDCIKAFLDQRTDIGSLSDSPAVQQIK